MNLSKSIMSWALIMLVFGPAVCHAELGEAPMPKVAPKKSDGPSLEETFTWISQKLDALPAFRIQKGENYFHTYRYRAMFNGCTMVLIKEKQISGGGRPERYLKVSMVPLQDLKVPVVFSDNNEKDVDGNKISWIKPETISIETNTILNVSFSDADLGNTELINNVINGKYNNVPNSLETMDAGHRYHAYKSFIIDDYLELPRDLAESMSNALNHAALLCRKKEAEDRAAQPPKPKDLF